jgi:hypothetical protein
MARALILQEKNDGAVAQRQKVSTQSPLWLRPVIPAGPAYIAPSRPASCPPINGVAGSS